LLRFALRPWSYFNHIKDLNKLHRKRQIIQKKLRMIIGAVKTAGELISPKILGGAW
jgi:hypothetical protein